ncbi:uncharacterized protein LOC130729981 isoform X2 [Lotus japonicus]|uniref:uncharacterized protein LOC130729981 isoform X2 n=1 Tax=Lotus japonicus TaxID=34305 RepID=UPI002590D9D9|nr:uncharacterized protein LOC130729981 isoform X2 [Lotus japonicus]
MVLVGRNSMSENWRIAFELSLLFVTSSFVVVSKTVTTAETMLVARIISEWIPYGLGLWKSLTLILIRLLHLGTGWWPI